MALTDAQIERYSRQIILPEIGGTGQERLAEATVVLAGAGTLAQVTGRALAGCGIGHLRLATDAGALVASLRALNSTIDLQPVDAVPAGAAAASIAAALAAGLDPAALETLAASMRAARVPLVAAAVTATGGWLHVDDGTGPCALCASVSRPATPDRGDEAFAVLSATVLGSLLAFAAVGIALDRPGARRPMTFGFDAATAALTPVMAPSRPACPLCNPGPPAA